jgi:hypothetical protein
LVVPLSSAITYLLFAMIIIGLLNFTLARIIGIGVVILLKALVAISRFFAGLPGAAPGLSVPFPFLVVFYFLFIPRWRKFAIWVFVITAVFFAISGLPRASVLLLDRDKAQLILPDRTSMVITDRIKPDHLIADGTEITDYLIAPAEFIIARKGYFKLPNNLSFKKFQLGEWRVDARKDISLIYRDRSWIINDPTLNPDEVIYVITRGDKIFQFTAKEYGSLFDRCVTEFKLLYTKLRLLTI